MRRLFVLLLLLPLPLVSQVKILMPVVVKDAGGKAVTDLKISDFQVSGPKNVRIDNMWLVQPAMVSGEDTRTPVVVLYDAANATDPYPNLRTKWLRSFLAEVAEHSLPITFYVNTPRGLQVVYEPGTPPEVLAAALNLRENQKPATNDPKVTDQAQKLKLLDTSSRVRPVVPFHEYGPINQMSSLIDLAKRLGDSDKRKAVLWLADATYYFYFPNSPSANSLIPLSEMATEQLNAADVSVYPDFFDFRGTSTIGQVDDWLHGQQKLAACTGGLSLTIGSISDALQTVLADFSPYYMLAVAVPTPKETDWIPVKIKVNRPGLTVRAAPGFLGLKPEKAPKTPAAHP